MYSPTPLDINKTCIVEVAFLSRVMYISPPLSYTDAERLRKLIQFLLRNNESNHHFRIDVRNEGTQ